jgi:hypothetical protein
MSLTSVIHVRDAAGASARCSAAFVLSELSLACVANPIMIAGFARGRLRFRTGFDAVAMRDINNRGHRAT